MSARVLEHAVVRHLLVWVSLGATPLVLFVCSANNLYLTNQAELHYQPQVLLPFVQLFVLAYLVGIVLWALSNWRPVRYLLCAYYVLGPLYLAFLFLQKLSIGFFSFSYVFDTLAGVAVLIGGFAALVFRLGRRFDPKRVAPALALFTIVLLAMESYVFKTQIESPPTSVTHSFTGQHANNDLPNIYHIIFDGYQSDFLSLTLTPELSEALEGFIWFQTATSRYTLTEMSLPSIFTGTEFVGNVSRVDYMRRAYDSKVSFLGPIKEMGYMTLAYLPIGYRTDAPLLDQVVLHRNNAIEEHLLNLNTATFKRLWLYASFPRFLTRSLMETEWFIQYGVQGDVRLLKNERFLAYSRPVASYLSFLNVLEQESHLPDAGRYTLFHVFVPHPPDVFSSDCSYGSAGIRSGPLEMTRCANSLLLDLVTRLKELDRFDNSILMVHGDHGGFYRLESGQLIPTEETSDKALLLMKPLKNRRPFVISETDASLMDIAPTLLHAVGADHELVFDGRVLPEANPGKDH